MTKRYFIQSIFSTFFFITLPLFSWSQTPNTFLRAGYGYFANVNQVINPGFGDVPSYIKINPKVEGKAKNGSIVWFDFGYKLNTGFTINGGISIAETKYFYNDGLGFYWDFKQADSYKVFDLSFGKKLNIKPIGINLSLGFIYQNLFSSFADYDVHPAPNPSVSFPTIIEVTNNDLGMSLKGDVEYTFRNNFFLGIRAGTHLIFAIGFDNIFISPIIGLKL